MNNEIDSLFLKSIMLIGFVRLGFSASACRDPDSRYARDAAWNTRHYNSQHVHGDPISWHAYGDPDSRCTHKDLLSTCDSDSWSRNAGTLILGVRISADLQKPHISMSEFFSDTWVV